MVEQIQNLKKVELHIHLDGAVNMNTIQKLSGMNIEDIRNGMVAPDKCLNLSEYLTKFDLPGSFMQSKENITLITKDVVDYFESQNIIYAEVRFAPMFHTKNGLSYDEIIAAVLTGLRSNPNVKCNLICCAMRGFPLEDNKKTVDAVKRWLGIGVVALDLAGAEDKYPTSDYYELFEYAKEQGVPVICHAGENGSYNEVDKAIEFGALRIGHGIHSIESIDTINKLKENNIILEVCPTSNVQTNSVDTYENHPIKKLIDSGVQVCINTDNKTVSNVTLNEEYIKLYQVFGFDVNNFKDFNINAINHSFLSDVVKIEHINKKKQG